MLVFLDIDGVLIHRRPVAALNRLCVETDGQIVLSSTWRLRRTMEQCGALLSAMGITAPCVGATGAPQGNRGHEILDWRMETPDCFTQDYVVITNDIWDIVPLIPPSNIIYVREGWYRGGLTMEHVYRFLESRGKKP